MQFAAVSTMADATIAGGTDGTARDASAPGTISAPAGAGGTSEGEAPEPDPEEVQYRVVLRALTGSPDCLYPEVEEAEGSPCATLVEADALAKKAMKYFTGDDMAHDRDCERDYSTHHMDDEEYIDAHGCITRYRWWAPYRPEGIRFTDISELFVVSVERESVVTGKRLLPTPGATRYHVYMDGADHYGTPSSRFLASVPSLDEANRLMKDAVLEEAGCQYEHPEQRTEDNLWFEAQHIDGTRAIAAQLYDSGSVRAYTVNYCDAAQPLQFGGWLTERIHDYLSGVIESDDEDVPRPDRIPARSQDGRSWGAFRANLNALVASIPEWPIKHSAERWPHRWDPNKGPNRKQLRSIAAFNTYMLTNHSRGWKGATVRFVSEVNGEEEYPVSLTEVLTDYKTWRFGKPARRPSRSNSRPRRSRRIAKASEKHAPVTPTETLRGDSSNNVHALSTATAHGTAGGASHSPMQRQQPRCQSIVQFSTRVRRSRRLAPAAAPINTLPEAALRHILLGVPHTDLLQHVATCAQVCLLWRSIVVHSAAYGSGFATTGNDWRQERSRTLSLISDRTQNLVASGDATDRQGYPRQLGELHMSTMGDHGADALSAALVAMPAPLLLTKLDLKFCCLTLAGAMPIARSLRLEFAGAGLRRVNLGANRDLGVHRDTVASSSGARRNV